MTRERDIEAALERFFHSEGWSLDCHGDHFAMLGAHNDNGEAHEICINLSECARAIVRDLA